MNAASNIDPVPVSGEPIGRVRRVRHETRRRRLAVTDVEILTPGMLRVTLYSPDLGDFVSLSPDDHIKLFFPGQDGVVVMRDYTPRRFDVRAGELVIDFAVHDVAGPATLWASTARPGDHLEIGGPRGSAIIPDGLDWYLLVGDETALPAIGRRLEEFSPNAVVRTVAMVGSPQDRQEIETSVEGMIDWVFRGVDVEDDVAAVIQSLDRVFPKSGVGFVWIAGEAQFARRLREHVLTIHAHPPLQMKAAGYWRRGDPGAHESLD